MNESTRQDMAHPLVLVDWSDSCENVDNSDQYLDDLPQPQRIIQCGFLIKDEVGYIVIASALKVELGTVDYAIAIPRCAIASVRYLDVAREE